MNRWTIFGLISILAAGLGYRLLHAWQASICNFDTGTVGFMAVNILKGDLPLFFYGQNYMGALEAYVAAIFIWLFGPNDFALTLGTILFATLWIWSMYLLFTEMRNRQAGLWAAAVIAIPGYWTLKYSISTYGGYTIAFFCGTMALWIAMRIARRNPSGKAMWIYALGLGVCAGIGLWTHYIVAPYLAVAGLYCLRHVWLNRRQVQMYLAFACGACVAVLGLVPAVLMRDVNTGSHTTGFVFSGNHMEEAWTNFYSYALERLLFWNLADKMGVAPEMTIRALLVLILAVAFIAYLVSLFRDKENRIYCLAPLAFMLVFLLAFLPHALALEKAPRYTIPFVGFLLSAAFGLGMPSLNKRRLKWTLSIGIGLFFVSQMVGQVIFTLEKRAIKQENLPLYQKQVEEGKKSGVDNVMMVSGATTFMHHGQSLGFYAEGQPNYVAAYDERVQRNAQAAEIGKRAWTCEPHVGWAMWYSFIEMGAWYQDNDGYRTKLTLFLWPHPEKVVDEPVVRSVDPSTMVMHVNEVQTHRGELLDRDLRTTIDWLWKINIAFEEPTIPHSLWFTSPNPLPRRLPVDYEIWVAEEGGKPYRVNDCPVRISDSYKIGPHAYFKGYMPRQEIALKNIKAPIKYLEMRMNRNGARLKWTQNGHSLGKWRSEGNTTLWKFNEMVVFAKDADGAQRAGKYPAFETARARLKDDSLDFVITDRWASATLIKDLDDLSVAFPRYNPKYTATLLSRVLVPRKGLGLLVDAGLRDETEAMLRRSYGDCIQEMIFTPDSHYALFTFKGEHEAADPGLIWNGHMLLRVDEAEEFRWH